MSDFYDYEFATDITYCYPGTDVLKNKLNIRDWDALHSAEREITSLRAAEFLNNYINEKCEYNIAFF